MTSVPDDAVRAAAARAFARGPEARPGVEPGQPVLVRDLHGAPSYWLVPGTAAGGIVAIARVLLDGRLATLAWLPQNARDPAEAVTGIGAAQAAAAARVHASAGAAPADAAAAEPVLVHDGPVGREAWRVDVTDARGTRTLFATGGGVYEDSAET